MTTHLEHSFVLTASIKPFTNNARLHSKQQVARIAASIQEFGFTNPVLIDEQSELIAGHGRLQAAIQLSLTEVPAIRVLGLTEAQKRALRLADNRLAERSTWSKEALANELKVLVDLDYDVELTGFDAIEIDGFVTTDGPGVEDEPVIAPPPTTPVSQLGDLWKLGPHRLLCGDAREPASYQQLLADEEVGMVITDVPYNVPIKGHVSGLGRHQHSEFAMASGEMSPEQFRAFLHSILKLARDASRDGAIHYVFIDWRSIADVIALGRELYSELKNLIAWVKPNGAMGSFYRSQHELIAVFKHGRAPHVNNVQLGRLGRYRSNVWQYPGASGFSKTRNQDLADHPTPKPVRLIADAIRDASHPGDLILDPFGGAGTAILAAEDTGRRAALIEIEPKYVDVALRRYREKTGIEPTLAPHGVPLSVVTRQRSPEVENTSVG